MYDFKSYFQLDCDLQLFFYTFCLISILCAHHYKSDSFGSLSGVSEQEIATVTDALGSAVFDCQSWTFGIHACDA